MSNAIIYMRTYMMGSNRTDFYKSAIISTRYT